MSNTQPIRPVAVLSPPVTAAAPKASESPHSATTLSPMDVSYVDSLMGAIPAQRMEEILLKTGVPIPANLGPNIDTTA